MKRHAPWPEDERGRRRRSGARCGARGELVEALGLVTCQRCRDLLELEDPGLEDLDQDRARGLVRDLGVVVVPREVEDALPPLPAFAASRHPGPCSPYHPSRRRADPPVAPPG